MPNGAHSIATARGDLVHPALGRAVDRAAPTDEPATEPVFRITPPSPCCLNWMTACLQPRNTPRRFTATSRSKSSTVWSSNDMPSRGRRDADVVEDDVEPPEVLDRGGDRIDVGFLGHVALTTTCTPACLDRRTVSLAVRRVGTTTWRLLGERSADAPIQIGAHDDADFLEPCSLLRPRTAARRRRATDARSRRSPGDRPLTLLVVVANVPVRHMHMPLPMHSSWSIDDRGRQASPAPAARPA